MTCQKLQKSSSTVTMNSIDLDGQINKQCTTKVLMYYISSRHSATWCFPTACHISLQINSGRSHLKIYIFLDGVMYTVYVIDVQVKALGFFFDVKS